MRKTASQVLAEVAKEARVSVEELKSQKRPRHIAWLRQEAYFRIYTECRHMSLPAIGKMMGGRDHTTIRWGIMQHCARIGVRYETITRKPVYCRREKPYVRGTNVPVSMAHYREAQRYAV